MFRAGLTSRSHSPHDALSHHMYIASGLVDDLSIQFRWNRLTNPVSVPDRQEHRYVPARIAHGGHIPHIDTQPVS